MRDDFFTFKQFKIRHRDAAMKVGTDAVLLGSWAFEGSHPQRILDVGTGCGLMALMLAQRFEKARVSAIELEEKAMLEAQFNFEQSPFSERMHIHCGDFLKWDASQGFDAIICNPPYFQDKLSSSIEERNMARQERFLPPTLFFERCKFLISNSGVIALILPIDRKNNWIQLGLKNDFFVSRICEVKGFLNSEVNRILIEFSIVEKQIVNSSMFLYNENKERSVEYSRLALEFYP
jgi:tRNA1Val (adenine37-N6)-methyltransferase